jgi:hypothetical protein
MVLIDAGSHSEHVQVIKGDFKPGSTERSIGVDKVGIHYYELPRFLLVYGDSHKPKINILI